MPSFLQSGQAHDARSASKRGALPSFANQGISLAAYQTNECQQNRRSDAGGAGGAGLCGRRWLRSNYTHRRNLARQRRNRKSHRKSRGHCKSFHIQASNRRLPNFLHRRQLNQKRDIRCKVTPKRTTIAAHAFPPISSKGFYK